MVSSNHLATYAGHALADDTTYYWLVRWWDGSDTLASDSAVASFDIAFLNPAMWGSSIWIGDVDINIVRAPFTVPEGCVQLR